MAKLYHYTVTHPAYGTAKVQATDNIGAVREAATSWGITKWTSIAREVEIRRWSAVKEKKQKK